jgi:dihydrofolate reductase
MRKVIANEWMTLDGVVQAPSYPDEDVTGGFRHGGWHTRYFDDLSMNWVIENVRGAGGYLLGRGTYEIFAAHWPTAPQVLGILVRRVALTELLGPLLTGILWGRPRSVASHASDLAKREMASPHLIVPEISGPRRVVAVAGPACVRTLRSLR